MFQIKLSDFPGPGPSVLDQRPRSAQTPKMILLRIMSIHTALCEYSGEKNNLFHLACCHTEVN